MSEPIKLTPFDIAAARATPDAEKARVFGRPLHHIKPFLSNALDNFTLVAPALLLAATILSILAIIQTTAFVSAFTREIKSSEAKKMAPLLDKKLLTPADYQSAANVIAKNNSAVQISLPRERNAILLSIKDPALLPEFIYALVTVQSYRQGVAWNALQICLSKCEGGNAATAEITGYTQTISFSGVGRP